MNLIRREKSEQSKEKNPTGNNALKLISFHAEWKFADCETADEGERERIMALLIGIKLFFIKCEGKLTEEIYFGSSSRESNFAKAICNNLGSFTSRITFQSSLQA